MAKRRMFVAQMATGLFGSFNYQAPAWSRGLKSFVRQRPLIAAFLGILLVSVLVMSLRLLAYYQNQPKAPVIIAQVTLPRTPDPQNDKMIAPLELRFVFEEYQSQEPHLPMRLGEGMPDSALVRLSSMPAPQDMPSVAALDLIQHNFSDSVSIEPAISGKWRWLNDHVLQFTPEQVWQAGQQYRVKLSQQVLNPDISLKSNQLEFTTHALDIAIENMSFYQDPRQTALRQVISSLRFNYPINEQALAERIHLDMQQADGSYTALSFDTKLDESGMIAYLRSQQIDLPERSTYAQLRVSAGITSTHGGKASQAPLTQKVLIPDVASFLEVSELQTQIVRDEQNRPMQYVILSFNDDINPQILSESLSLYALPQYDEDGKKLYFSSARQVTQDLLQAQNKVATEFVGMHKQNARQYQWQIDLPPGQQLYLRIAPGLMSVNGFVHKPMYDALLAAPQYPKELRLAGEGSILASSTLKKLGVSSLGLDAFKVSIGKVNEDQVNHLVSQTRGDIASPEFKAWTFSADNLADYQHQIIPLLNADPSQINYASVDTPAQAGLYFVSIKAWDPQGKREIYGIQEQRLLLITDIGLIVKGNADGSQDVFVQSIEAGKPLVAAQVSLLGKNGQPLFQGTTDGQGHVNFASPAAFTDEQQPTVYLVKHDNDLTFIPYDRYSRQLNYSKFDVGGDSSTWQNNASAKAFIFSDRGIYRPGETVNLAAIVKNADLSPMAQVPLEWVVRGPDYQEMAAHKVQSTVSGMLNYDFVSSTGMKTGSYIATLHLLSDQSARQGYREPALGSINFSIEAFQADTQRITSTIKNENDQSWLLEPEIGVQVNVQNLFGLAAQDVRVELDYRIQAMPLAFEQYANFVFNLPTQANTNNTQAAPALFEIERTLGAQKTDPQGNAYFAIDTSAFTQGSYVVNITTRGFDNAGGRAVEASNRVLFSPFSTLIGLRSDSKLDYLPRNSQAQVMLVAINNRLREVKVSDLQARLFLKKMSSTLVEQANGTFAYENIEYLEAVSDESITIDTGGNSYALDTSQAGAFVLQLHNKDQQIVANVDYVVIGQSNLDADIEKDSPLLITLDKDDYLPGETMNVSIQAPYAGSGLLTIETDHVEHFQWFSSDGNHTTQQLTVPAQLEGNAYVNVTYLRDISSPAIFTRPLSYAVAAFSIDRQARIIETRIELADINKPGQQMKVSVSSAQAAKAVVFAVDEGILQVADYQLPDPLGYFLQKRALGVNTMQMLDLLLPDFALLRNVSAAGGDRMAEMSMLMSRKMADGKNLNPFVRKVEAPAVFWSHLVDLEAGENVFMIDVPQDFSGAMRVMAVSANQTAIGRAQATTLIQDAYVISPSAPVHAAVGDEFVLSLNIANLQKGSASNTQAQVSISSSEHLQIMDSSGHNIALEAGQQKRVSFTLLAKDMLGAAYIDIEVSGEGEASREVSRRRVNLSVRPSSHFSHKLHLGQNANSAFSLTSVAAMYPQFAQQTLSVSRDPLLLAEGLSDYLEHYPHGCTEQVVSQVFPLVGLSANQKYAAFQPKVAAAFTTLIERLRARQGRDGGFTWWPSSSASSPAVSVYVMQFLIDAKRRGFNVPSEMLNAGINYLDSMAQGKNGSPELSNAARVSGLKNTDTRLKASAHLSLLSASERAKAIYLLTKVGRITSNYLVDLVEGLDAEHTDTWRSSIVSTYVAASYKLMQQDALADEMIHVYAFDHKQAQYGVNTATSSTSDAQVFSSSLAHHAQHLYLLASHFASALTTEQKSALPAYLSSLSQTLLAGEFNTIEAAYSILALGAYSEHLAKRSLPNERFDLSVIDSEGKTQLLATSPLPFVHAAYPVNTQSLKVVSQNGDKEPIFFIQSESGYPRSPAIEAVSQGIEINRQFINMQGELVHSATQGEVLTVRLQMRALGGIALDNIAIVDLLPAGFEVLRPSVRQATQIGQSFAPKHIEIREDRLNLYGRLGPSVSRFEYQVRLSAVGEFAVPPVLAESMYDRRLRAHNALSRIKVNAPSL